MTWALRAALLLGTAVLLTVVPGKREIVHRMRACHCACERLSGVWPWLQEDIDQLLQPGETVLKRPWSGGVVVCLTPGIVHPFARFDALQDQTDDLAAARVRVP